MNKDGKWKVSPAYDLTFSSGPVGQHCTTILGEGKNPTIEHILKLSEIVSIKPKRAKEIVDEVKAAVSKWGKISDKAGVSKKSSKAIKSAISLL
jgi:serine/threonine-protein kinase HipA